MSLSSRILIGLIAGILTGLFFGELVSGLKLVGDVFVKLLQVTVLPYIVASLIAGFGRMQMSHARKLAVMAHEELKQIELPSRQGHGRAAGDLGAGAYHYIHSVSGIS